MKAKAKSRDNVTCSRTGTLSIKAQVAAGPGRAKLLLFVVPVHVRREVLQKVV